MKLRFDVDALTNNPYVYSVTPNKLRLKIDFRILLFKEWKESNSISILKQILDEHDITKDKIYPKYYQDLITNFKMAGFPVTNSVKEYEENFDIAGKNPLVSSGLYNQMNDGKLNISDCFLAQLYSEYPDVSVEDGMKKAGLSMLDAGQARMYRLNTYFKYYKEHPEEYKRMQCIQPLQSQESTNPNIVEDIVEEIRNKTKLEVIDPPYILYDEQSQPRPSNIFFNEAYHLVPLGIEKIFDIYSIPQKWLPIQDRMRTKSTLLSWIPTSEKLEDDSALVLGIQRKRLAALVKVVNLNFQDMKEAIGRMDITSKRLFFQKFQNLPPDPLGFYTIKRILSQLAIPRSTYYEIISNDSYGSSFVNKARQDDMDIEIIRTVKDYKGFEKGIRQISDGTDRPDDKLIPFLDNEFVIGFKEDRLFYSKDFDIAMYKKIQEEGMTYVKAYNTLGFDTNILGEDRANAAGKRIMQKARDHKLFTIDESNYDGSVSMEQMGNLSPEEERAYLKARNHYLEELIVAQKKIRAELAEFFTS